MKLGYGSQISESQIEFSDPPKPHQPQGNLSLPEESFHPRNVPEVIIEVAEDEEVLQAEDGNNKLEEAINHQMALVTHLEELKLQLQEVVEARNLEVVFTFIVNTYLNSKMYSHSLDRKDIFRNCTNRGGVEEL